MYVRVRNSSWRHATSLTHNSLLHNMYISQRHRDLIINGHKAVKGRYPYFATIEDYCGGALIAPDIVLAAGHCKGNKFPRLRVGTYSFVKDIEGEDYEKHNVIKMVRHPAWERLDEDEFLHDFLLLKLERPSSHHFIRLNRHEGTPRNMQEITAMGMGYTHPDYESRSDVLREVKLNAIANDVCEKSFDLERDLTYEGRIQSSHMCTTGGPNNERDAW